MLYNLFSRPESPALLKNNPKSPSASVPARRGILINAHFCPIYVMMT